MMSKKQGNTTQVTTRTTTLDPLEEKVVRMRHGLRAPDTLELEMQGEGNPELQAKLVELEKRALSAVGARNNATKRKIVNKLRNKH